MSGFFTDAGTLLIQVAFGVFIFAVLLRFLLQLVRADFYNPLSQFVVALTNPLLKPLRRVIPGLLGIDVAAVVLMLALQGIEVWLLLWLRDFPPTLVGVLFAAVVELVRLTLYVFFFAVILRALLSWVNPYGMHHHPLGGLLVSLTEPLMRPARRLIPAIGGLDLSPIAVLVAIQLLLLALSHLLRLA